MTTTTFTGALASDHEQVHRATVPVGVIAFVVAAGLSWQGADSGSERLIELPFQLVMSLLLFGWVVPRGLRHESAGGRGLILGVLGLLLVVPAFWSGLPVLLGAAAALLGYAGKHASHRSGPAIASLVVGLLGVLAYLTVYVADYMHVHGIG